MKRQTNSGVTMIPYALAGGSLCRALLLAVILLIWMLASCQAPEMRAVTSSRQPYIQLKDGNMIHAHEVRWSFGGFNRQLSVNDSTYNKKDIYFYSNGYHIYANVRGNKLAPMVSEGNINVFHTQKRTKLHPRSQFKYGNYGGPYIAKFNTFGRYYIQNRQHPTFRQLQKLNYKNLEPMIPESAQAYTYLRTYKHQRNITNITTIAGVSIFAGGAFFLHSKGTKTMNPQTVGMSMMAGGLAVTGISLSITLPRRYKLYEVARLYNSVK